MQTIEEHKSFGGTQGVYRHHSDCCGCDMTFGLYLPPAAAQKPVPLVWFLSGLTCTHENAMIKGGLQSAASEHGLAVIFPDTSPRGDALPDDDAYDMGQGAGFYLNAEQPPWQSNFKMQDYILQEIRNLVMGKFPLNGSHGITGHSMGGHGALCLALKHPALFDSLSAFAPIANPAASEWGRKQFTGYLGADEDKWREHDASHLMANLGWKADLLIDQGTADQFLDLLRPEALAQAIGQRRQPATIRLQDGYDHSYFFVNSFAAEHISWHAARLKG